MSRPVRAVAALTLLVLLLVAGPVAAATPAHVSGVSLWDSVWQWLVEMVLPGEPLPDPERPEPGTNGGDAGGAIDPDGSTASSVTRQPNGEVRPAMR